MAPAEVITGGTSCPPPRAAANGSPPSKTINSRVNAWSAESAMLVGDQRTCCNPKKFELVSIALNSARRATGPMIWTQPRLAPDSIRLISEKLSSPSCDSQSWPENVSKATPKPLRTPYAKIFCKFLPASPPRSAPARKNGLCGGVVPSSFNRNMTPGKCALSGSGPPADYRPARDHPEDSEAGPAVHYPRSGY